MNSRFDTLSRAVLLLIGLAMLLVIYGWVTHILVLVQLRPDYPLIQPNTSMCLLGCAIGFYAILKEKRRIALLSLAVVTTVAMLTLFEYLFDTTFGIDTLIIKPFTTIYTSHPGRMGLNTNIALLALSIALLNSMRSILSERRSIAVALLACAVFALGAVPLLGYAGGIQEAYRFGTFTRMSLPSCIALILLGTLLLLHAERRSPLLHRWLPIPIFIGLMMVSMSAAVAVRVHEEQQITQSVQAQANERAASYSSKLQDLYGALDRISLRWEAAGGTPKNLWDADTAAYMHDLPFLSGISWIDNKSKIRWISPLKGRENLIGRMLSTDPVRGAAIAAALQLQEAQVTPPILFLDGSGLGFAYYRPLKTQGAYGGMINAGVHLKDFFALLFTTEANVSFQYVLSHGDQVVLASRQAPYAGERWKSTAMITNLNDRYRLTLYPSPAYVAAHHTFVPAVVFLGGSILSALLALATLLLTRERRQAGLVREKEQFIRTILESASYLIVAVDTKGIVQLFNRAAEEALGYTAEEIIGKQTPLLWHDPVELDTALVQLREKYREPELIAFDVFTYETLKFGRLEHDWTFIRDDGTCFLGRLTTTPRFDPNGNLLGFLGIIKDMTEQKRQEALLRASEESFRLAMQYSPIGMALVAPDGRWMKVNAALCEIIGYSEKELLKSDFQHITHRDDLATDLHYVQQLIAGKIKSYSMEKRYIHKQGNLVPIQLSVSLIRNEDGTPKYFISMIQDISEREQFIEQLRQTNSELEQFAYVASHDLQEPLRMVTSFVGLLDQLYADKLDAQAKEFITIAVEASKRMAVLISDLLEYARLGRDSRLSVRIDCNAEMRHVLLNLDAAIKGAGATIRVGHLPEIIGNPVEFLRLMQNLIGNAIKFHRRGMLPEVTIGAAREGDWWLFTVQDNGIGMKSEYYERIFQPFKRLHNQQEYQGSGIGLAVCRKIVENFGGKISVESVVGEGSSIRFTVPAVI